MSVYWQSWSPYFVRFNDTFVLAISSINCMVFEVITLGFLITAVTFTTVLPYLRVCAVWGWNRFIVTFFGISLLFVVASLFTLVHSIKQIEVESYCNLVIVGPLILAPFLMTVLNYTFIVLAITYGVCKNTLGDLTFKNGILLMLGKTLPAFSKALLHDSQVCYMWVLSLSPQILW